MQSIYLPGEEETNLAIHHPTLDEPAIVDIFQLDEWLVQAGSKAKETGRSWMDEWLIILNKKLKVQFSKSNGWLLYHKVREEIDRLKKKSLSKSESSTT